MKPAYAWPGILFVLVCLLTLAWQPSAAAEAWRHRDPSHDVARVVVPSSSPTSHRQRGDITRIVANHDADVVRVKLRVRKMPAAFLVDVPVKVPGRTFRVTLRSDPGATPLTLNNRRLDDLPCDDPNFSYRLKPHAFLIAVPRACLGTPSAVRVGASLEVPDEDGNLLSFFEDDAGRRGVELRHLAHTGPWLDPT